MLISLNSPFPAIILFGTEESDTLARKIKHRHSTSTVQFNTMSVRGPSLQEYLAAKSETQLRNYLFKMEGGVARLCHHHYILLVGFNCQTMCFASSKCRNSLSLMLRDMPLYSSYPGSMEAKPSLSDVLCRHSTDSVERGSWR